MSFEMPTKQKLKENLGQNLGYDRCPYLSFFVTGILKGWDFLINGSKRLKYRVHQFWPVEKLNGERIDKHHCGGKTAYYL